MGPQCSGGFRIGILGALRDRGVRHGHRLGRDHHRRLAVDQVLADLPAPVAAALINMLAALVLAGAATTSPPACLIAGVT